MATAVLQVRERGVAVGRVFELGFSTIRHHPLQTLVVAFLFTGLPGTAADYMLVQLPWRFMVMTVGSFSLPGYVALGLAGWFVSLLFGAIAQGAMARAAIAASEGRKAPFAEILGAAFRVLLPLVFLGVIIGVGVIIGTTLLIVPGVLIYIFWSVAPSAAANERDGVFLALSRSQELGEGARLKIFAITLVLFGISLALAMAGNLLTLLLAFQGPPGIAMGTLGLAIRGAFGALGNVVAGAVMASLYVELKEWKEGSSVEALERVFV
jgi:hypothetical protein